MPRAIPGRPSEAAPRAAPLIALRPDGTSWLGACGKNPACVKPDGHRGACKCNVSMKEVEYEVEAVLDAGYRTRDIVNEGNADETLVGCKEMGDLVAAKVAELAA